MDPSSIARATANAVIEAGAKAAAKAEASSAKAAAACISPTTRTAASAPFVTTTTAAAAATASTAAATTPSPAKRQLSDFDVSVQLGKGLTSTVKLCRERATGTFFALKVMDKLAVRDRREQVFRERDALQALDHPFVVRLAGTFQDETCLYFILSCAGGGDLFRHIRGAPGGHLCAATARVYAAELVLALAHVHGRGFVYRDLKASNVILDEMGRVQLCDFGFAKRLRGGGAGGGSGGGSNGSGGGGGGVGGGDGSGAGVTGDADGEGKGAAGGAVRTNTYCGTPHAMAPEVVLRGGEGHGFEVDWWAMGVLMYVGVEGVVCECCV